MNAWMMFWSAFLFVGLAAFAVMSICVTIGGYFDIKRMFRRLNEAQQQAEKSMKDERE